MFWALVAFLCQRGRWTDCPRSRDPTRLHCQWEHFLVHPMSWGWSTWITQRRPNPLTRIASLKHLPASAARNKSLSSSQFAKKEDALINVLQHSIRVSHCCVQLCVLIQGSQEHNCSRAFKPTWKRRACYSSLIYLWPGAMVTQRSNASKTSSSAGNLRWCMIAWNKPKKKNRLHCEERQTRLCVSFTKEHTQMKKWFCARFES